MGFSYEEEQRSSKKPDEAPAPSESDRESEYMTSTEDCSPSETKETVTSKKVPSRSSSFIQNILYEDSCTGVTVIDLFIALKSAKENLDSLSLSNEKISKHVNNLNEETEIVWKEFVELLERMRLFLDKMNADVAALNLLKLEEKLSNAASVKDTQHGDANEEAKNLKNEIKGSCTKCGKDLNEIQTNDNKKLICLGCLISAFQKKFLSRLSVSPEAFLGSFLASVLYWQKEQKRETKSESPKSSCSTLEEIKSEGSLNIRESTVQMICDICEILNVATVKEECFSFKPVARFEADSHPSSSRNFEDTDDEWSSSISNVSKNKSATVQGPGGNCKIGESSKERAESRNELTSEGDSEFEEALTCQLNHQDRPPKPSVTCMGDLSKAVAGKKSASTITVSNNVVSSWVGKLSDVIKSKIKEIKSKRPNRTNVKVFDQSFEKSETALKKHPGMLQFSITASTSAGVFDVTVVQYKNHSSLAKPLARCEKNIQPVLDFDSHSPPLTRDFKEKWSDESLTISESVSMDTCSNFGDDEMGEFLEIYVQNKDKVEKEGNMSLPTSKSQLKGNLIMLELKSVKPYFLEMHRSYPVYCVQEFVKRARKDERNERSDAENLSNDSSEEEEVFSLNSNEKQEKQIVIPGSSSDLVIYIQVEIEDDSRSNSAPLVIDFEKNSSGTQTNENNDKSIRLGENQQKGESLFNVWKTHEMNENLEMEDMERITFEEPLVVTDKLEEEEQEVNKSQEDVEENLENVEQNISRVFLEKEKEIKDTSLETEKADVLVLKESKQSAPVWYNQVPRNWKLVILKLNENRELPIEVLESINSSAGELKKALHLIREIETDIVDAQIDDAISILPRLELELRKHLQTKIKDLEQKETSSGVTSDDFLSGFDFVEQRDDSISGDSDESSEYRFNNLLKLLSNLEEAVKASEHGSNKIELSHYDSSKIYELLHALTDSIRELEEDPNVTSLSQTLDIASRLDTAVREYDSIVKKQPADYLIPQERCRKRRNPRWSTTEEASVTQHLKNVRKKVFEMVETEAVGMEERIERDFDRVDRLETENDEALMFLEALLQKTQKRMLEFQNLKANFKDLYASLNIMYETFQRVVQKEIEERREAEKSARKQETISSKVSETTLESAKETISEKVSETDKKGSVTEILTKTPEQGSQTTLDENSENDSETTRERYSEMIQEKTPLRVTEKTTGNFSEPILQSVSNKIPNKVLEKSTGRSSLEISKRNRDKSEEEVSERSPGSSIQNISRRISDKITDNISKIILEKNSERISESSLDIRKRNSENIKPILDNNNNNNRGRSLERIPERISKLSPERSLEKISKKMFDEKRKSLEEIAETSNIGLKKTSAKSSERSLKTLEKGSSRILEKIFEKISKQNTEKVPKGPSENSSETSPRNSGKILGETASRKIDEKKKSEISLGKAVRQSSSKSSEIMQERDEGRKCPERVPEKPAESFLEIKTSENEETLEKTSSHFIPEEEEEEEEEEKGKSEKEEEESLEKIVSSFINAIDYLKSKSQEEAKVNQSERLTSTVKEFKVIGENSLYLSWTQPEGSLESSIVGYEIYVDGKLNQKVRNPHRVQAVLYSVDLSKKIQVQLYAIVDKNFKLLLASMDLNG